MYGNSLVLFLNCRIEHDDAGVKTFFNVADAFFENDLVVFNPGNLQDVVKMESIFCPQVRMLERYSLNLSGSCR